MNIRLDELTRSLAVGLDAVEGDFLGASTNHGARIATLCSAMGRHLGFSTDELLTVSCCALLHDNALTEYILSERPGSARDFNMRSHCVLGQENAENLPFPTGMKDFILYHHERADGKGPFGATAEAMPLGAQLISISDMLDSRLHLQRFTKSDLAGLRQLVEKDTGTRFTPVAAQAFLAVMDEAMLEQMKDDRVGVALSVALPAWTADIRGREMMNISAFVRKIIDYKSAFTKHHSTQVANIVWQMACFYGFDEKARAQLYFASSLHDLGKLFIPGEILEKPAALTAPEYTTIQSHIVWTQELLGTVGGLEDIARWAGNHHEKLDGSGYPGGLCADEQDEFSRIIACADNYQAIGDKRPYHGARSHEETAAIVWEMVEKGQLDGRIAKDMAQVLCKWPMGQVPPPDSL